MKIEKFEDIIAWRKAEELTLLIYKAFKDNKDFGFKDQIQKASVSIMNNIAEGFERRGDTELKRFLFIAKGSCGEVRSMSYIAEELKYATMSDCIKIRQESVTISKILSAFIKKLQ